jgi:methionyl aminopeptidase
VVCHGIPDSRKLIDGDLLSIDVSVFLDGYHGDNCGSIVVGGGSNSTKAQKLVDTTKLALDTAVSKLGPGV